jgi:hypothetical protein
MFKSHIKDIYVLKYLRIGSRIIRSSFIWFLNIRSLGPEIFNNRAMMALLSRTWLKYTVVSMESHLVAMKINVCYRKSMVAKDVTGCYEQSMVTKEIQWLLWKLVVARKSMIVMKVISCYGKSIVAMESQLLLWK